MLLAGGADGLAVMGGDGPVVGACTCICPMLWCVHIRRPVPVVPRSKHQSIAVPCGDQGKTTVSYAA